MKKIIITLLLATTIFSGGLVVCSKTKDNLSELSQSEKMECEEIQKETKKLETDGLKVSINSALDGYMKLPKSFTNCTDENNIGEFLKEKNELSKKEGLDFSKYLGKRVKIYYCEFDRGENTPSEKECMLFIYDSKIIGKWIRDCKDDTEEEYREEYNKLIQALEVKNGN